MPNVILRPFSGDDKDWLVEQHGVHYARVEGFDETFGPLVDGILTDFLKSYDPDWEAGWIAEENGRRLGSIFCVKLDETTAKLRLFLLVSEARGKGLGKRMLASCMGFARDRKYSGMQLWTHESHRAAGALYRAAGWTLDSETPVHSFGKDNVEQIWSIRF